MSQKPLSCGSSRMLWLRMFEDVVFEDVVFEDVVFEDVVFEDVVFDMFKLCLRICLRKFKYCV